MFQYAKQSGWPPLSAQELQHWFERRYIYLFGLVLNINKLNSFVFGLVLNSNKTKQSTFQVIFPNIFSNLKSFDCSRHRMSKKLKYEKVSFFGLLESNLILFVTGKFSSIFGIYKSSVFLLVWFQCEITKCHLVWFST